MENCFFNRVKLFNQTTDFLKDRRLSTVRNTVQKFQMDDYTNLKSWELRKKEVKSQILMAAGLWPMPEKTELHAQIFDKLEYDSFTIEKVLFESYPGFFVTGSLFRPKEGKFPYPAILNPHGHAPEGRLEQDSISDEPLRSANFAQMGLVSFSYDMVGYCDSKQVTHEYGGFSQELWGVSLFGLQLWNSIRCIDFLQTLPDVDGSKIGCTGASGGGTQTFTLAAVDERIKVCSPVCMVSNTFQGGCLCENAPNLRLDTNNIEISAAIAPRPMLLIGCTGDWTSNLVEEIYPEIKKIYTLYGKSDQISYHFEDTGHNYNRNSREAAYHWFLKHLAGTDIKCIEQDVCINTDKLKIYSGNTLPEGNLNEDTLFHIQREARKRVLHQILTQDSTGALEVLQSYMKHITGANQDQFEVKEYYEKACEIGSLIVESIVIGTSEKGEQIPLTVIKNKDMNSNKATMIVHPEGKLGLSSNHNFYTYFNDLLKTGTSIILPDLFLTGEFNTPYCKGGRDYTGINVDNKYVLKWKGFFTTYNYSDDALRIQDIVRVFHYIKCKYNYTINIKGMKWAGAWVLASLPYLDGVNNVEADMREFDTKDEQQYIKKCYMPGFLAAGGFETCIRLGRQKKLTIL